MNANWIKRKFLKAMMPYNKAMSYIIRQRPDFHSMTSSEVLDEFVAMSILEKTADNAVLRSQRAKKPNLALKAKANVEEENEEEEEDSNPEDTKYAYHEHMALASRQFLEQEELKTKLQQEQLKWLQGQATSKNLLQLWQCEPFRCGLSLQEAGRQWWQAHPKRQGQVLPQQEQLHPEDSSQGVGGSRGVQ